MMRRKPYKSAWPTQDRDEPLSPLADWLLIAALLAICLGIGWGAYKLFGG